MTEEQFEEYLNNPNKEFATAKEFQEVEKEYLNIVGYCKKVQQGIGNLTSQSGERALWELVQNARDMGNDCRIRIELKMDSLVFMHYGKPFDYISLLALVKQDSSKDDPAKDLAGQYGTGFMTTHAFNRVVEVSAPYEVRKSANVVEKYIKMHIVLDRSNDDMKEAYKEMNRELNIVEDMCQSHAECKGDEPTVFRYVLGLEDVKKVSDQIARVSDLLPFVLLINEKIHYVEICDNYKDNHYILRNIGADSEGTRFGTRGWSKYNLLVQKEDLVANIATLMECNFLRSEDKEDVVIIPPFPNICGQVQDIPSLFLWFPLLGTESFGVNFIFHSRKFYPVEKRNNIQLPEDVPAKREVGQKNELVLRSMMEALFEYYQSGEHDTTLPMAMCRVDFIKETEDEELKRFYHELQELWNYHIVNWRVIPTSEGKKSVADRRVRLLSREFYDKLEDEERIKFEPIIRKFASRVCDVDGVRYLLPSENLIEWSELVSQWQCKDEAELYITLKDVCSAIQDSSDDLLDFLLFLKENEKNKFFEDLPLIPNRLGVLRKKGELGYGNFMTDSLYDLVAPLMGDDVNKMIDPKFLDICSISAYEVVNLHNAITGTMGRWRNLCLSMSSAQPLSDQQVMALIAFCSASSQNDSTNYRQRMMGVLPGVFGKVAPFTYQPRLEEKEEEFFSSSFNLLLEYTLKVISGKDEKWVENNKGDLLLRFLTEYATSKDSIRSEKLNLYSVIPSQKGVLRRKDDLKKNVGISEELALIYLNVVGIDLHEDWIDPAYEDLYADYKTQEPKDIVSEIQNKLVEDMREGAAHKFEKIVRQIILNISESTEWADWFKSIDDNKAKYTFSMASGDAQKGIFSIMDMEDEDILRLAELNNHGQLPELIGKMERQLQLDNEKKSTFAFCYRIGKAIENRIRLRLGNELLEVQMRKQLEDDLSVDDIQNGQDMIIRYDGRNIYYVEVKAKWNFDMDNYAHMSTNQVRMAALHPECYALCCVDLSDPTKVSVPPDSSEEYIAKHESEIFAQTKVHMHIGEELSDIMRPIQEAENDISGKKIRLGDYRANITKSAFKSGNSLDELIEDILKRM